MQSVYNTFVIRNILKLKILLNFKVIQIKTRQSVLILFNNNYKLILNYINLNPLSSIIETNVPVRKFKSKIKTFILNKLLTFNNIFFIKIKFKGKGYRIYKSYITRNALTFTLGYSHFNILLLPYVNLCFLNKLKLILTSINYIRLKMLTNSLVNYKKTNIFTNRGLRYSKQTLLKKTGKISNYR